MTRRKRNGPPQGGGVNRAMLARPNRTTDLVIRDLFEERRNDLAEALELAAQNNGGLEGESKWAQLLMCMRDPSLATHSISTLMVRCDLILPELLECLRNRDIALGMMFSGRHIARVLDDIGEDAKTQTVRCRNCKGEGVLYPPEPPPPAKRTAADIETERIIREDLAAMGIEYDDTADAPLTPEERNEPELEEPEICEDCSGMGELRKIGDADARKMFLNVMGLDKRGSGTGPTINLGVGVQVQNSKSAAEPVTVKVQKILGGS